MAHALLSRALVRALLLYWSLALLLTSCTADESRCAQAAEALASCHGIDGDEFLHACNEAPAEEANALADEVLAQSCPSADGKADGLGEIAFVAACRPALLAGYLVSRARNPNSAPLASDTKAALRPYFGSTVDGVRVHWNATLLDDWPILHIENLFMDPGAQTYGARVFAVQADTAPPLEMLAHELTHTKQAERAGSLHAFATEYCRGFYESGFSYDRNPLEVEAVAEAERIMRCLTFGC